MDFSLLFKALGENTRIRIIKLLSYKPMYVCELEAILLMSQPRISQHLKILKQTGLVNDEKDGQRTIYTLNQYLLLSSLAEFNSFLDIPLHGLPEYKKEVARIEFLRENPSITICPDIKKT
ncbi:transcriptional regulator, ArsR family [Geosporobacter subterraneus DSM 17957]|uniref:Transcriptional regulator, ArsR family n=1 Tax=Geosporobacter subterraneus DSM 17957 TaxID=1121919 RepID=A0A1M6PYB3_9FIRM|nr:metalloregulator ArsR/SmtB family transcription factor [Geosporobacter subterraneus]SHK12954.1 transcriptional regulator, ArsR family [Geosporobacter subterraneus DSM 17957]